MSEETLSVVVLVGGGRSLGAADGLFDSLRRQTRQADEIVLVLNGFDAANVAERWPGLPVKVVSLADDVGCPAGRNRGATCATCDIVVFLDDDGTVTSDALAAVERLFSDYPDAVGLAGRTAPSEEAASAVTDGIRQTVVFSGGAFAVRRDAYLAVGGYKAIAYGEEIDLALRLFKAHQRVYTAPDFVLIHPSRDFGREHPRQLANSANLVRCYFEHYPLPAACVGLLWKVGRHGCALLADRQFVASARFVRTCLTAAHRGFKSHAPLSWRELRRVRALRLSPVVRVSGMSQEAGTL